MLSDKVEIEEDKSEDENNEGKKPVFIKKRDRKTVAKNEIIKATADK